MTFIKKGGWGLNYLRTNFFFAIVTEGLVELCMTQFPLIFPFLTYLLAHLHGNFQYFPYF